jgi:hypothetical protein
MEDKINNTFFEIVAKFKYLRTILKNKNCIYEEIRAD